VTSNRKHEVCDDSSSDADEFAYVIDESRRALQFTRDEISHHSSDTTSVVSSTRGPDLPVAAVVVVVHVINGNVEM